MNFSVFNTFGNPVFVVLNKRTLQDLDHLSGSTKSPNASVDNLIRPLGS